MAGNKDVLARINNEMIKQTEEDINRAYEELFQAPGSNNQLPEHVFVERFLPYFSGKVVDSPKLNIQTNWIGIAGSATSEVDVIDSAGKVIFTVPSLMSTDFLSDGQSRYGRTFGQIFQHAQDQSTRIPRLGDEVIGRQGSEKVAAMPAAPKKQEEGAWNSIFSRYGVSLPDGKKPQANGDVKKDVDASDELDF